MFQPCRETVRDCSWLTVISASKICPLCTLCSHVLTNFNSTRRWIWFFCKWTPSVALTAFGLSEGNSLGWTFGLKICQFDTCLFQLTVCTCVHCQSLCVLRVYVCVSMSVNCICLFFFHDLTFYSVKEAETQWEPLHFLPYFLLLNVTSKQINSLRILISQEITYLIYITILLFLVCTHRAHMLSSLFLLCFLWAARMYTNTQRSHIVIRKYMPRHSYIC